MLCTVYRLRSKGQKLDRDVIRRSGSVGDLNYRLRLIGKSSEWHVMTASLVGPDGEKYVYPVLDRARLVKIKGNGALIAGVEIIPISRGIKNIKADYYQQTWWCVPCVQPQTEPTARQPAASLGWRERSAIEHAERWGLPIPTFGSKESA